MKKILTVLTIVLFTINASAQDTKATAKEEKAKCEAKCKAEGKKCDKKMAKADGKKCCAKKA